MYTTWRASESSSAHPRPALQAQAAALASERSRPFLVRLAPGQAAQQASWRLPTCMKSIWAPSGRLAGAAPIADVRPRYAHASCSHRHWQHARQTHGHRHGRLDVGRMRLHWQLGGRCRVGGACGGGGRWHGWHPEVMNGAIPSRARGSRPYLRGCVVAPAAPLALRCCFEVSTAEDPVRIHGA